MLRKLTLSAAAALTLSTGGAFAAGGGDQHIEDFAFPFEGPFGSFDQNQLQRGLQVFTEVCASCHGLKFVPIRTLGDEGGPHLPEDQVRAYAAQWEVFDPELDDFRPAKETDHFPPSNDPNAPDLSLMAKARSGFHGPLGTGLNQLFNGIGGAEYIASLLVGYNGHEVEQAGSIFYENETFAGGLISMSPPSSYEIVEFADGSPNDAESIAKDVAAFLMWTAEPKMMARQQTGFVAVLMLTILSVLLYLTNKKIWAPVKKAAKKA